MASATLAARMASADLTQNDKCLLTELADGSGVILHLETKFYYTLNATGVAVWKAIGAGANTEQGVVEKIVADFDVDAARASADVASVLATMRGDGLVRSGSSG
jgi:Coenzyme PQQ synthesis protein D (PqqD)